MTLYSDLGVNPGASPEEIKRAHRRLARQTHPDRGGDPEEFHRISHAYMVLHDPVKREKYDRTGDDSSDVDNPLAAYAEILMPAFDAAIAECINDLDCTDIIMVARQKIAQSIGEMNGKLREADQLIVQLKRVLKRLRHSGSGPDIIRSTLDARVVTISRQRAHIEQSIAHRQCAMELATDYSWQREPPPQYGFATTGSTAGDWR